MDPLEIQISASDLTDMDRAYNLSPSAFERWARDTLGFEEYLFDNRGNPLSLDDDLRLDYNLHLGIDGVLYSTTNEISWLLEVKRYARRRAGPSELDRFVGKMVRANAKHGILVAPDFSHRAIIARRTFAYRNIDILLIRIPELVYAKKGQSIEDLDCMEVLHRLGHPDAKPWLRAKIIQEDIS